MRPTALDETDEEFLLSEECLDRTNLTTEALRDGESFETALESFDRFLVAKGKVTQDSCFLLQMHIGLEMVNIWTYPFMFCFQLQGIFQNFQILFGV